MPPIKKRPVVKRTSSRKRKTNTLSNSWRVAIAGLLLILLSPFYYGYILKFASATWFWIKHPTDDKNYRTYESFDIKIPKKYTIHGIDVSYYQGKIDWRKVKAIKDDDVNISFAFIKASHRRHFTR